MWGRGGSMGWRMEAVAAVGFGYYIFRFDALPGK